MIFLEELAVELFLGIVYCSSQGTSLILRLLSLVVFGDGGDVLSVISGDTFLGLLNITRFVEKLTVGFFHAVDLEDYIIVIDGSFV